MTRILFIHNTAMWYRIPFFESLNQTFQIKFIFTHMQVSRNLYGVDSEKVEVMEEWDYQILPQQGGVAWGVIGQALKDYDLLVGGSWDTLPEALETMFYFLIARLRNKPFIIWREDWDWKDSSLSGRILKPFIKFIVKNSSAVLVPGSIHQKYFISLGASPEKVFIMPNVSQLPCPEDLPRDAESLKKELGWEERKIILYVGRLIKRKGVDYLIRALKELEDEYVLMVVGEGECRDALQDLAQNLGIKDRVVFRGNVPSEDLANYYVMGDMVVVPSITCGMGDPWVMVLNEAMFLKKPVLATTAVGAAPDMIQDGNNGFIIPEADVKSMASKIHAILSHPERTKKMGQESYKIIMRGFQYSNMLESFKNAVKYVLKK